MLPMATMRPLVQIAILLEGVGRIARDGIATPQRNRQWAKPAVLGCERVLALALDGEDGVAGFATQAIPPLLSV